MTAVITDDGVDRFEPRTGQRAISRETAATITWMMQAVVDGVLGHPAQVDGWPVAGKSGTSDVVESGSYLVGESLASFAGFAPADDPRVVVLVRIDRPQGEIYGGIVAAPIFSELMAQALPYLGVPPTAYVANTDAWDTAPKPDANLDTERPERADQPTLASEVDEDQQSTSPVTYMQDDVEDEVEEQGE